MVVFCLRRRHRTTLKHNHNYSLFAIFKAVLFVLLVLFLSVSSNNKRNEFIMTIDEIKAGVEGFGQRLDEIRGYL